MARTHTTDRNQARLPLHREDRLAALHTLTPELLGIGRRSWSNLIDLLEQIEFCTLRDGCFAYCETLAARMNGKRGVSRATFFRTRALAEELGLLVAHQRTTSQGAKQSNKWEVNWDRVMALAVQQVKTTSEPARPKTETRWSQTETTWCQTETRWSQTETLHKRNNPVVNPVSNPSGRLSTVPTRKVQTDGGESPRIEPADQDRETVKRIIRRLGDVKDHRDLELVARAVLLIGNGLSEHAVWDSVEAVDRKSPANRYGYFRRCLEEHAQRAGHVLWRLLRGVTLPTTSVEPVAECDLSERLCGGHVR